MAKAAPAARLPIKAVWSELRTAGVDLINTDQLGKLRQFLSRERGHDRPQK